MNERVSVDGAYGLSPMQAGMLFQSLYNPGKGLDIEQLVCEFTDVDPSALEHAWQQVWQTNDVLRTGFDWAGLDQPVQYIHPAITMPWGYHDWVDLSDNPREKLENFLRQDRQEGFKLNQPPLMRLTLIRVKSDHFWLIWTFHHILLDGRAIPIVLKQMADAYQAHFQGKSIALKPSFPYRDYILWLERQDLSEAKAYWKELLRGVKNPTPLGMSRPQPPLAEDELEYGILNTCLSTELTLSLKQLAEKHSLTLSTLLQGVWTILLNRYSGEQDVVFGSIRTGRHSMFAGQGLAEMVGLLINTLPVRVQVDPKASVLQMLKGLRMHALELRGSFYGHLSLAEIQKMSELPPRNRLFDTILAFESVMLDETLKAQHEMLKKWDFELLEHVGYPLVVSAYAGKQLKISLEYSRALFDAETARRILGHLHTLLKGIAEDPFCQICQMQILTEAERHQILVKWNDTQVKYPQDICIHKLFEIQAEKTPDAVAVTFEDKRLTYRELNQRANQLAHYLQNLKIGIEAVVGICLERSLEMVISVLGILKAGGAYLPLSPTYPLERLAFILRDAQASVVLTQQSLTELLPHDAIQIICLDSDLEYSAQKTTDPASLVQSFNLVYIIYTSGSTGQSKGVMVNHNSLVNAYFAWEDAYQLKAVLTVHLQMANFSFDVFSGDWTRALCSGGKLVICPRLALLDPPALWNIMQREAVNYAEFVPAVFRNFQLYLEETHKNLDFMRVLVIASDNWYISEYIQILQLCGPDTHLINSYGVTEATIDSSYFDCNKLYLDENLKHGIASSSLVPIGHPFTNTRMYILDAYFQPVPVGITGELYIGGIGVARGYLNQLELTQQRFIPDVFNPNSTMRLYKTGDLARYLPDGNIEFLGRIDHQVKIRGFRIELGEIEAVLRQHSAIKEVVVITQAERQQLRLVAYFIPNNESIRADIVFELRNYLKQKLPDYMVPSAFVVLEQFPLTPNGKIDLKVLPAPDNTSVVSSAQFTPPQTPNEKLLAQIWADLLGLRQVGRQDNFFELGGDSIVSLQFISRARAKGLYLTPRQVFDAQTIESLAQIVRESNPVQAEQGLILGSVPLTPIQNWFFEQHTIKPHHFNQSVWVEAPHPIEYEILAQAIHHLLLHHDALRLRFKRVENGWEQELAHSQAVSEVVSLLDLATLSSVEQNSRSENISTTLQVSLNIHTGPLFKVICFRLGATQPDKLLFIIHHLAVDYVSWQILVSDLWTVYDQLAGGQPPQLLAKSCSFKTWAEWLIEYAQQEKLQAELPYWLKIGEQAVSPLPVDRPDQRSHNRVAGATQVEISLSETETESLLRDVPVVYHTQINDILLCALAKAFAAWTSQPTLLIDLEGHGREAETLDLSRTVGWFTSLFPVCLRLEDTQDISTLIKSVKEQLRHIPQKGMGYGVLRYLNAQTAPQLATMPKAEISFNYGGQLKTVSVQLTGSEWAPEDDLDYLLNINAAIVHEQLTVSWLYSQNIYERATIENLARGFIRALQDIIQYCQLPQAGGYTPSDFPLANLSQTELDRLVGRGSNVADIYPLSPMQAGMLFHSIYAPNSGVYYIQTGFEINGMLDVARFKQAWQSVLDRHTILRTSFVWQDLSEPLQIVYQQVDFPWEEQDWRAIPVPKQVTRLRQWLQQERERGFELNQAPLTKCSLIRMEESRYQFIWHCHHLLTDGWSEQILFREVFDLYENPGLSLPPALPYRDYIAWLRKQDMEQAKHFWQKKLAGFSAPTPLVVDSTYTNKGYETYWAEFSAELSAQLTQFSRQYRLTLNTLIQGAYALLLNRYSGASDVLFGVTVSGRANDLAGIEKRLGPFLNTLPLRVSFPNNQNLLPWLEQIQRDNVIQTEYAHTPLIEIQKQAKISPGAALFESILVFENYPVDDGMLRKLKDLRLGDFRALEQTNYPLSIVAFPGEQNFTISFNFDRGKFDLDTVERMGRHLQSLLAAIVSNPIQPLNSLSMLTEAERRQLLDDWNDTRVEYPQNQCIHQLFETQVEKTPDATAVVFKDQSLTYLELNQRANQLAHYLQALGVGLETLVGICMERSLEMVVGMLGILKAGGAYLPIAPEYPKERIEFMAKDGGVKLLLTQQRLTPQLPELSWQLVYLDSGWKNPFNNHSCKNLATKTVPDNTAYVIYTSGSTGKPKGVEIEHKSLVNLVFWHQSAYALSPQDRATQVAGFSFDATVWEIWPYITIGACLYFPPDNVIHMSPQMFQDWLVAQRITVSFLPTPLAETMLPLVWPDDLSLRILLTGGDKLHVYPPANLPFTLYNNYGPTENTVVTTFAKISAGSLADKLPTIGRPIANAQVYILDAQLQPVPLGVAGELYIGGNGLARGYLNRPDLTAEKFIPNPFVKTDGSRLYKTGDLVRWLPDGNIEYLDRIDHQVKIRGFRIELGEIEAVLVEYPVIQTAVVVAKADSQGQKCLVGYITLQNNIPAKREEIIDKLRTHLKQKLPEYMIPGALIVLEQMPLSSNGKIDRKALPEPEGATLARSSQYVPPQTKTEWVLAGIWAGLLGSEKVGRNDNFFELGGHSLLALSLVAQIKKRFGRKIPLSDFMRGATVERLAQWLEAPVTDSQNSPLMKIKEGTGAPFVLVHPIGGNILCYNRLSQMLTTDRPVYGLQSLGLQGEQAPLDRIADMAANYVSALRSIQPEGPYLLAGWSMGGIIAFEMAQLLHQAGQHVNLLALLDSWFPEQDEQSENIDAVDIPSKNAQLLIAFFRDMGQGILPEQFGILQEKLQALPIHAQIKVALERAQLLGLISGDVEVAQLEHIFNVFKANWQAWRAYNPSVYPGYITFLKASEEIFFNTQAQTQRWNDLSSNLIEIYNIPGNHYTMVSMPSVQELAKRISLALQKAEL